MFFPIHTAFLKSKAGAEDLFTSKIIYNIFYHRKDSNSQINKKKLYSKYI